MDLIFIYMRKSDHTLGDCENVSNVFLNSSVTAIKIFTFFLSAPVFPF